MMLGRRFVFLKWSLFRGQTVALFSWGGYPGIRGASIHEMNRGQLHQVLLTPQRPSIGPNLTIKGHGIHTSEQVIDSSVVGCFDENLRVVGCKGVPIPFQKATFWGPGRKRFAII